MNETIVAEKAELELLVKVPVKDVLAVGNVRQVKDDDLSDLVASVKAQGILEPLLVTPKNGAGKWPLVFGFRRLAAAKLAGLEEVPVQVRPMTPEQVREAQLVENLQREDLNPIDEAHAFASFLEDAKVSQGELARRIGKSQPYVANRLRLLGLPDQVQVSISRGILSPSHGEVLLKIPPEADELRRRFAVQAVGQRVPVQDLERDVKWQVQQWQQDKKDAERFEHWRKTLKVPTCPTCKKPAAVGMSRLFDYPKGVVGCGNEWASASHFWNPKTGALVKRIERPAYSAPRLISATVRSSHDPLELVRAAIAQLDQARSVEISDRQISVRFDKTPPALKGVEVLVQPHEYPTGEKSSVTARGWDNRRIRANKTAFAAWEKKALPHAPAAKKVSPARRKVGRR